MGSPLAPVLANIFMIFFSESKFYLRYVDDVLAAFENEQGLLNFLNFWNNKHPDIIFIIEKQVNHSVAFLDVLISSINNQNITL